MWSYVVFTSHVWHDSATQPYIIAHKAGHIPICTSNTYHWIVLTIWVLLLMSCLSTAIIKCLIILVVITFYPFLLKVLGLMSQERQWLSSDRWQVNQYSWQGHPIRFNVFLKVRMWSGRLHPDQARPGALGASRGGWFFFLISRGGGLFIPHWQIFLINVIKRLF